MRSTPIGLVLINDERPHVHTQNEAESVHTAQEIGEELRRAGCRSLILCFNVWNFPFLVWPLLNSVGRDAPVLSLSNNNGRFPGNVGLLATDGELRQAGVRTHRIVGAVDDQGARAAVGDWIRAAQAVTTISTEVYGLYGGHSMGWRPATSTSCRRSRRSGRTRTRSTSSGLDQPSALPGLRRWRGADRCRGSRRCRSCLPDQDRGRRGPVPAVAFRVSGRWGVVCGQATRNRASTSDSDAADDPFWEWWWPHGHVIGWEHTFVHELHHLLDAIAGNVDVAPDGATFADGYRAAEVCDAVLRSAATGRREPVECRT
jgi:L-fucose isomerase, first N-terminal domain